MAKLIYRAISSLDGYVADDEGNFEWSAPDEEVHRFINDLERPIGTYLFGRRLYEVMRYWETAPTGDGELSASGSMRRSGRLPTRSSTPQPWRTRLTPKTRIEREFEPQAIEQMKAAAARDITVGGPTLAAQALKLGLVDECHFFLCPVVVGGGLPALPDGVRVGLELLDENRFGNGTVHLHYRVKA